ncbi:MAG: DNA repair protein RecO [Deltaproteobacteria bacterium]|nr:DNA repair protein RecO [Deltaproteobacteria bacterium]
MTERQTPAIVLTVRDYGEADLLVTFITPTQGRLTGLAKHGKKSRRRFAYCLEPLSRVVFYFSSRPGRDLEFLQKGELVQAFPSLRRDLTRLGAAAVLAEVTGLLAGPPEAIAEIFATLEESLILLDQGQPPDSLLPAFLLRLLTLGGYGPRLGWCLKCGKEPAPPLFFSIPQGAMLCGACRAGVPGPLLPLNPGTWKLLHLAQKMDREKLSRLRFPRPQCGQSLALLKAFVFHHLGRGLNTWAFWEKVTRDQPNLRRPAGSSSND